MPRYCRACSYDLRGSLESKRCPECGRGFDPADPRSTRRRPKKSGWRWVARAGMLLLAVALLLGGTWGWFWWEWKREQRALEMLGDSAQVVATRTIGPEWLHPRLGRAGFVLVRVDTLLITGDVADISPVAKLSGLTGLHLEGTPVSALSPLAKLTGLTHLYLYLGDTQVSDLTPLASLTGLTHLWLSNMSFLYPMEPSSDRPHVTDVSPLAGLTALEHLWLPHTIAHEQVEELQRALPNTTIVRW